MKKRILSKSLGVLAISIGIAQAATPADPTMVANFDVIDLRSDSMTLSRDRYYPGLIPGKGWGAECLHVVKGGESLLQRKTTPEALRKIFSGIEIVDQSAQKVLKMTEKQGQMYFKLGSVGKYMTQFRINRVGGSNHSLKGWIEAKVGKNQFIGLQVVSGCHGLEGNGPQPLPPQEPEGDANTH